MPLSQAQTKVRKISGVIIARQCASKRVEPFWMWYSAELIWVETLFIFLAIMVAISGI